MNIKVSPTERVMIVAALLAEARHCDGLGLGGDRDCLKALAHKLAIKDAANDGPEVDILRTRP